MRLHVVWSKLIWNSFCLVLMPGGVMLTWHHFLNSGLKRPSWLSEEELRVAGVYRSMCKSFWVGFAFNGLTQFQSTELCVIEKPEPHIGSPLTPTYCQFCTCNGESEKWAFIACELFSASFFSCLLTSNSTKLIIRSQLRSFTTIPALCVCVWWLDDMGRSSDERRVFH